MWGLSLFNATNSFRVAECEAHSYRSFKRSFSTLSALKNSRMARVCVVLDDSSSEGKVAEVEEKNRLLFSQHRPASGKVVDPQSSNPPPAAAKSTAIRTAAAVMDPAAAANVVCLLSDSEDDHNVCHYMPVANASLTGILSAGEPRTTSTDKVIDELAPRFITRSIQPVSGEFSLTSAGAKKQPFHVTVPPPIQPRSPKHALTSWWQSEELSMDLNARTLQILSSPGVPSAHRPQRGPGRPKKTSAAFTKVRVAMAKQLYDEWNALVFGGRLPPDLQLRWNGRLVASAGQCVDDGSLNQLKKHPKQMLPTRIDLSSKLITSPSRLRDVLAHEMCHAAAWVINGEFSRHHGPAFWKWANTFMQLVDDITITRYHDYQTNEPFHWRCVKCSYMYSRHRQTIDPRRHVCKSCGGSLEFLGRLAQPAGEGAQATAVSTQKKPRPPTGFSAFVQQHFATARKALPPGTPHGHVMKQLSSWWHEAKQQLPLPVTPSIPQAVSPPRHAFSPLSALQEKQSDPVSKRNTSPTSPQALLSASTSTTAENPTSPLDISGGSRGSAALLDLPDSPISPYQENLDPGFLAPRREHSPRPFRTTSSQALFTFTNTPSSSFPFQDAAVVLPAAPISSPSSSAISLHSVDNGSSSSSGSKSHRSCSNPDGHHRSSSSPSISHSVVVLADSSSDGGVGMCDIGTSAHHLERHTTACSGYLIVKDSTAPDQTATISLVGARADSGTRDKSANLMKLNSHLITATLADDDSIHTVQPSLSPIYAIQHTPFNLTSRLVSEAVDSADTNSTEQSSIVTSGSPGALVPLPLIDRVELSSVHGSTQHSSSDCSGDDSCLSVSSHQVVRRSNASYTTEQLASATKSGQSHGNFENTRPISKSISRLHGRGGDARLSSKPISRYDRENLVSFDCVLPVVVGTERLQDVTNRLANTTPGTHLAQSCHVTPAGQAAAVVLNSALKVWGMEESREGVNLHGMKGRSRHGAFAGPKEGVGFKQGKPARRRARKFVLVSSDEEL